MDAATLDRIKAKLLRELGSHLSSALEDPHVIEIMLNHDGKIWIERLGKGMIQEGTMSASSAEALMATIATSLNTEINRDNPKLEGELLIDGSRFEGIIPPIVPKPVFTIRKKASVIFTIDDYVAQGVITPYQRDVIGEAIKERKNILIAGGTGSGKTTLLNGVIDRIVKTDPDHRLVMIEDTNEIQCSAENHVSLRTLDDKVSMQDLLKITMRLRPDRILVGEVRGGEALALLKAWNTGHPGGIATVHANDAYAALIRLEQLIAEVSSSPMGALIGEAVDLVISIKKISGGRKVDEIIHVNGFDSGTGRYITKAVNREFNLSLEQNNYETA